MAKIKMQWDQVLIEPEVVAKSAGGIILPGSDQSKQRPVVGKVIAAGPGLDRDGKFEAMSVKVGDRVLFNQYPRTDVEYGTEMKIHYAVSHRQIVGVFE